MSHFYFLHEEESDMFPPGIESRRLILMPIDCKYRLLKALQRSEVRRPVGRYAHVGWLLVPSAPS